MKRLLLILFCVLALPVMASHIVGGEFEIIHLNGNTYRINLILYFDKINGSLGAKDPSVTARIFRKSDNRVMREVFLPLSAESEVSYTQPSCSKGEIETLKLVYTTTIELSPDEYTHPGGYYLAWERCCRNYSITNIYSEDPNKIPVPRFAGQTFYLEFPPVVKDGEPFINSSPRLFPPLNDYACPRKLYYVDFAGIDDDGDSLVYSLVTPLNTFTKDALPPGDQLPRPGPYPVIEWKPPFSSDNILAGNPDLKISDDGFLTVTPTLQGLFVFAVKCEEFRDGEKIGEVRRDFQMLVVDVCPRAEPPQILGKKLTDASYTFDQTMSVSFSNTTTDENRCINVQVSDPDASKQDDNFTEKIRIKAIPIGFKQNVSDVLPSITSATLVNGSTAEFTICFDDCPYFEGPYQVGIVAYDDACSLPLFDTLKITVNIEPPPNNRVQFVTPNVDYLIKEGDPIVRWPVTAIDTDGDAMNFFLMADPGVVLANSGMNFTVLGQVGDTLKGEFTWDPRCDMYDFTKRTEFNIKIFAEDQDYCAYNHPDTMLFKLKIKLPGNLDPFIDSDLTADPQERFVTDITRKVNESLEFNVRGQDGDNDFLLLGVHGKGFNLNDYGITFPAVQDNGDLSSAFRWDIRCDKINLNARDNFTFQFIVVDNANKCRFYKADTLDVTVKVLPPDNSEPILSITSLVPELPIINDSLFITLGQQISLKVLGTDADVFPDKDLLHLALIGAEGNVTPEGYIFASAEGYGEVQSIFSWHPDCSIFENRIYTNNYTFTFRVYDDRCFNVKADTAQVHIRIKDVDGSDTNFMPPNIITPNGDNKNDFFAMAKEDPDTKELINILPLDNCQGHFVNIRIFNRWGRQVFESTDREFRWLAANEAAGVYFYYLKYSNKEYKGSITVHF